MKPQHLWPNCWLCPGDALVPTACQPHSWHHWASAQPPASLRKKTWSEVKTYQLQRPDIQNTASHPFSCEQRRKSHKRHPKKGEKKDRHLGPQKSVSEEMCSAMQTSHTDSRFSSCYLGRAQQPKNRNKQQKHSTLISPSPPKHSDFLFSPEVCT